MSMSQEEIEALMNGLDIAEDESPAEEKASENTSLNTDEIEELIAQTDEVKVEDVPEPTSEIKPEVNESVQEETPELDISSIEEEISEKSILDEAEELMSSTVENEPISNDDIDDLLKDLESDTPLENDESSDLSLDNFDDILADVDGIVEPSKPEELNNEHHLSENDKEEIVKDWTDSKINEGIIPLPAEKDTKVVNQLTQVANDSEEKVSQIFDVLSLSLDNNNELRSKLVEINSFIESQNKLLASLNSKFPNINVFEEHLTQANKVSSDLENLKNIMNAEDMKIFEAMELMQFNDINRQKIERVMAVIRKLSLYLNNLFEDNSEQKDFAVAKHIHGDDTNDLIGDDLDKLIEEFGK